MRCLLSSLIPLALALGGCADVADTDLEPAVDSDDTDPPPPVDADDDGFDVTADCDDDDPEVFPGAEERCNGVDDDCDDAVDEEAVDTLLVFPDDDGDGFGAGEGEDRCELPWGHVTEGGDCDDQRADVNPGGREVPLDGLDNDCASGDYQVLVYVVSFDGRLSAVDRLTGEIVWTLELEHRAIDLVVGPDGTIYVTDYDAGGVVTVDPETREVDTLVPEGLPGVHGLTWDAEEARILATTNLNTVHAVDPGTGALETLFSHRGETIDALRWPGTSRILFTTRTTPGLWVHDEDTGDTELFATLDAPPSLLTLTEDGDVLTTSQAGVITIIERVGGDVRQVEDRPGAVSHGSCYDPVFGGLIVSDHEDGLEVFDGVFGVLSPLADGLGRTWGCGTNWPLDGDGDGEPGPAHGGLDCDDQDPDRGPHRGDDSIDGVDQDCDGIDGPDADGDGGVDPDAGGTDCDDDDPHIYLGTVGCPAGVATCMDILRSSPGARTGVHLATQPLGGPFTEVWCDMETMGGGWELVARSAEGCDGAEGCVPEGSPVSFSYQDATGALDDTGSAYSLGHVHRRGYDQMLFGRYEDTASWGEAVYVHELPRTSAFPLSYKMGAVELGRPATVRGSCTEGGRVHTWIAGPLVWGSNDPTASFRERVGGFSMHDSKLTDADGFVFFSQRYRGLQAGGFFHPGQPQTCEVTGLLDDHAGMMMFR